MLLVSDASSSIEGGPLSHAHMGGRCGSTCPTQTWLVDLGDRPPHRSDRKTVRKYLAGDGTPGVRARPGPDPFDPFVDYVSARLIEDPHLWARTLYDELEELGFGLSYQSLTRNIRARNLRPACAGLPDAPPNAPTRSSHTLRVMKPSGTGWNCPIHPNPGGGARRRTCWSARWRIPASGGRRLSPSEDQPHLVAGLDRVTRGLGGVTRVWRFDRMATVCDPGSGRVTASFAGVAKHYGVSVAICPPRRGNRKGVVEKVNHTAAQRWWRTLADETHRRAGPSRRGSLRPRAWRHPAPRHRRRPVLGRRGGQGRAAGAAAGDAVSGDRGRSAHGVAAGVGVLPRQPLLGAPGTGRGPGGGVHPVGGQFFDIATAGGIVVARHRMAADGLGVMVRDSGHVIALDTAAMATAATGRPHRRKERIPPGPAAKAAAAQLLRARQRLHRRIESSTPSTDSTVIDLSAYERAAQNRTIQ